MNKIFVILITLTLISCNKSIIKEESTTNKNIENNSGIYKTIPREQCLGFMRPAVATSICDDKNPIRSCFRINKASCEKAALDAASSCTRILKKEIPKTINRNQARMFGGVLGVCTAKAYAFYNKDLYIKNKLNCKKYDFIEKTHNK